MTRATSQSGTDGVPHFMNLRGKALAFAVNFTATMAFLLFGYDQGVMSGIISAPVFNSVFPETKDDTTWQAVFTSLYEIGALIGALIVLVAGDRLGRRKAIMGGAATLIIGVVIQVTAYPGHSPTAQFLIGRIITGVGNGMNTATVPTWQSECSRTTNRGFLICISGATIAYGTLTAYWIDFGASYGPPDLTWRFPIAFQCIFALFVGISVFFLPESPRWLLTHDRHEEAVTSLAALRGLRPEDDALKREIGVVVDSIRASGIAQKSTPYSALFTGGKTQHFRRSMLGASSQAFQQFTGCNSVIYYFPILFETSIIPGQRTLALLLGGINMIVYSIFASLSYILVERVGRRKLFLIGTAGQGCSMILVFACLIPGTQPAAKGAAVGLFTYIAFFGATWLPLPWLYPAEINPLKTRAKANAVSTCVNWLSNFTVVMITPVMLTGIGFGTYVFFAAINALVFPVIYFFYPETAGRSLEEIDLIFAKGYTEKMSYVRAAKELPRLSDHEIEDKAREYGVVSSDDEAGHAKEAHLSEKEDELATDGARMA